MPVSAISTATANLDIVLAKGRHWPLAGVVLFGDGKGRFTRGAPCPISKPGAK